MNASVAEQLVQTVLHDYQFACWVGGFLDADREHTWLGGGNEADVQRAPPLTSPDYDSCFYIGGTGESDWLMKTHGTVGIWACTI